MYLLEMLPFQIAGGTKIQPNYHGNIHSASKTQSHLADSENFSLEMSMVWRWARRQTAVNICHLCDDRLHGKQMPAPPSAWWAGDDPAILFLHNPSKLLLQPVELVLARVEDLWRKKKWSEVRQSRAASGMVLCVFSVKWLSMQCSNTQGCICWWDRGLGKWHWKEIISLSVLWCPARQALSASCFKEGTAVPTRNRAAISVTNPSPPPMIWIPAWTWVAVTWSGLLCSETKARHYKRILSEDVKQHLGNNSGRRHQELKCWNLGKSPKPQNFIYTWYGKCSSEFKSHCLLLLKTRM